MTLAILLLLATGAAAPGDGLAVELTDRERDQIEKLSPLPPPPADPTNKVADDPRAAQLGQFLFFDPRLSRDGKIACATCHVPETGFADGKHVSFGLAAGERHTPSLLNAAYQRWFFWDGRADSLWSQALQPIENPIEMGGNRAAIAQLIRSDPDLRTAYEAVLGPLPGADAAAATDHIFAGVGKVLAAYERKLISTRAPFDAFVEGLRTGDATRLAQLSAPAQRGLKLFLGPARCRLCHNGPNFSDGEFHNTRIAPLGGGFPRDPGRYEGLPRLLADPFNALGAFSDDREVARARLEHLKRTPDNFAEFKTPSLRAAAASPPYMHAGQLATLRDVVLFYSTRVGAANAGHHQEVTLLPLDLSDQQIDDLVAFLESLRGAPLDPALLVKPASPIAGKR